MIKTLITTGLLYGLLQQPVSPEVLNGTVSADINQAELQPEVTQIDLSRFHNARSDVYSSGINASGNTNIYSSGINQTNLYSQLNAASQPQLQQMAARCQPRLQPLYGRQQRHSHALSAIGVLINSHKDVIFYIDPNSDLAGKVQLGDRMLTINGEEAMRATRERRNLGNEQTLVNVQILHKDGQLEDIQCYRHPVAYFSPQWQRTGMY